MPAFWRAFTCDKELEGKTMRCEVRARWRLIVQWHACRCFSRHEGFGMLVTVRITNHEIPTGKTTCYGHILLVTMYLCTYTLEGRRDMDFPRTEYLMFLVTKYSLYLRREGASCDRQPFTDTLAAAAAADY